MNLPIFQVDAFSEEAFGGNPAAVCPLDNWLPEDLMQKIALENNLSETAFFVPEEEHFHIRWFTPTVEVALCGHATLASAHVLFNHLGYSRDEILFDSKSGILRVTKTEDGKISLDFPRNDAAPVPNAPDNILKGLHLQAAAVFRGRDDFMVVLDNQEQIEGLKPDFELLKQSPARGIVVTAPGRDSDFVSRCFYPQSGINEDPVTGSAHTMSAPFWSSRLGKNNLTAYQLSERKGYMECRVTADRVIMTGSGITFMKGEIIL